MTTYRTRFYILSLLPTLLLGACELGGKPIGEMADDDTGDTTTDEGATDTDDGSTDESSSSGETGTTDDDTGTTTGEPEGECLVDADCQLVNDCCACGAIPADEELNACPMDCLVSTCEAEGLGGVEAACRLGVCALEAVECVNAECNSAPPNCAPGQYPRVVEGCWSGSCVDAFACAELPVGSCAGVDCGEGYFCIEDQAGVMSPHCEPTPQPCDGAADCECLQPWFDSICQGACSGGGEAILCENGG